MTTKQNSWIYVSFDLESRLRGALDDEWRSVDETAKIFAEAFDVAKAAGVQRVKLYVEGFYVDQERQLSDEEQAEWDKKLRAQQDTATKDRIAQLEAELAKLKGGGQ
ncbi:MAG: hypothetical protein ACK53W_04205 [Gemmatimonadota bacterium]|jgi:uncharacterized linocin/CFP29 family protein